jgi:hypothetical protein
MTELPRATLVGRRTSISIPAAFILVWVAYVVLLGTRSDDVYGAYHNDVFWPADTYLASADPGIALPIFAHVMITLVGGLFLLLAVAGVCRLLRRPSVSATVAPFVLVALFCYSFLFVRAIPDQITVVDRDARELRVRTFGRLSQLPGSARVISGREITVLGAKVGTSGSRGDATNVVRIFASLPDRELVYLGMRACPATKTECASAADSVIAALAVDLGRTLGTAAVGADGTTRAFPLNAAP